MESRLVLILHPDETVRRELCARVQPLPVVEAASREEAIEVLNRLQPMFVVMHHEGARRALRDIDRHAPGSVRVVLCPDDVDSQRELLDIAEGLEFTTVGVRQLDLLPEALKIRRSARLVPPQLLVAKFMLGEQQLRGWVSEVGNDGLALTLDEGVPVESLQPGTGVSDATVEDANGAQVLQTRSWVTRALGHEPSGKTRLGVSFLRHRPDAEAPVAAYDPIRVGALVHRATRRGERFVLRTLGSEAPHPFSAAEPDATFQTIALAGPGEAFREGDIVQLSFELSGRAYAGLAVVRSVGPRGPTVSLPRTLRLGHRRHSLRITPQGAHRATVTFRSFGTGQWVDKELCSLHPRGAAFEFDANAEVFPDGLVLDPATLKFGGQSFPVRLVVQSSTAASQQKPTARRCGLALELPSPEARQVLLDGLVSARQPEVVDGSGVPFERLWALFEASSVHFPDYPPGPGPHLAALEAARGLLGNGQTSLGKSLVWTHGDSVEAHCGGLRIYSKSWFTQHLVVRPGYRRQSHVSEQMVNLMVDYAEALEDVEYLSAFWRAENRFMARVCGAVARKLAGTGLVSITGFDRLRRATPPELPDGPSAHDADASEVTALLAHLRATREPIWLRCKDLLPGEVQLETLGSRYRRSGLSRGRAIGAVCDGRAPRGWALLEEMTPGLFWAELHSGFRLVLVEPDAADADLVRAQLLRWVATALRRRERAVAECLAEPGDVPLLESLGFSNLGGAIDLTIHRQVGRQWSEELLTMFERFSAPRSRRAAEQT